jgi:2-dehydro-3-deoxy-L-rhamnonate dehydrogenase (NAD+)
MNRIDLEGRVAIVTGGGSGLGLATVARLRQSGADVTAWDRDADGLERAQSSLGIATAQVDIADPDSVDRAVAAVMSRHGRIDILVCSAGILGSYGPAADYPIEEWRRIIDVNLTGTFLTCRAVLPAMTRQGYGRIITVSSSGGKDGYPMLPAYVAAKAGVIGLSKSIGKEVAGQGIVVNCVTPGIMNTPMGAPAEGRMDEATRQQLLATIPVGRVGEPEEVASLITWLASEDCSYSAGAVFDASGGATDY